ncbi:hypothetical protein ACE1CC_31985 [Aerosakkonemataceae cyanobacterium BLCC-F46]|uniref:Uncharacterized protein n=1 Tax=Floridaenema aerugineum BLCC-F46 TaxID=3153654 RepID=A0ABV4XFC9_9CYAN
MKIYDKCLKPNPFTTYRDPKTGKWVVVIHNNVPSQQSQASS